MPLGRAWLLLGGLLPVEYDDLVLTEHEPERLFQERSSLAPLDPVAALVVTRVFRHRHRRLAARWGAVSR